jgi:plastocyanin
MAFRSIKLAVVVVVLACGLSQGHAKTVRIVMESVGYTPEESTATVGDTIEWTNKDIFVHTATARNGDWEVTIGPDKTASMVLSKAGMVEYYCRYHPNMTGRIVVAPK